MLKVLLCLYVAFVAYTIFASDTQINFKIEWDTFDSALIMLLIIIGLIGSLGQKFHIYEA
jgi:hypothetical protein